MWKSAWKIDPNRRSEDEDWNKKSSAGSCLSASVCREPRQKYKQKREPFSPLRRGRKTKQREKRLNGSRTSKNIKWGYKTAGCILFPAFSRLKRRWKFMALFLFSSFNTGCFDTTCKFFILLFFLFRWVTVFPAEAVVHVLLFLHNSTSDVCLSALSSTPRRGQALLWQTPYFIVLATSKKRILAAGKHGYPALSCPVSKNTTSVIFCHRSFLWLATVVRVPFFALHDRNAQTRAKLKIYLGKHALPCMLLSLQVLVVVILTTGCD